MYLIHAIVLQHCWILLLPSVAAVVEHERAPGLGATNEPIHALLNIRLMSRVNEVNGIIAIITEVTRIA